MAFRVNRTVNGLGSSGIGHLLDHTMRVWRPVESKGTRGEIIIRHAIVYPLVKCAVNRQRTVLTTEHGGIVPAGRRKVYIDPGPAILERDIVQLLTGSEAPQLLEVESPSSPRGHHIELEVSEFQGEIRPVEGS